MRASEERSRASSRESLSRRCETLLSARVRRPGPDRRDDLSRALLNRANGAFKAGCVSAEPVAQTYFDQAHADVAAVARALGAPPPASSSRGVADYSSAAGRASRILGEATLVDAVTTMCEAHAIAAKARASNPSNAPGDSHLDVALDAVEALYRAEFMLRGAVGAFSEPSIYTHGNLAEAFLHVLHELPLGLLHERFGCAVALEAHGPDHPSARRKLAEFADVLAQIGMADLALGVRRGDLRGVPPSELVSRLRRSPWREILPSLERPRRVALRRRLAALAIPDAFWTELGAPLDMVRLGGAA